jgi:hypothetical protein
MSNQSADRVIWPLQIGLAVASSAVVIMFDMTPPSAWCVGWISAITYLAIERRINRG